ncbi:MBL fold metallo-hydrolase [Glaciecola siphonariae]|uniref:MBL fold metallo-hydrolase n=1 Tax=Glaciecola siphonariae TaxID=521012 RepID=A0ABV9LZ23_9ALTE
MQLHTLRGYIQNIFLAEYPHGLLLLDGACRADFTLIEDFIVNTLNRPLSDLKALAVTHMHPDHAGCAHYLRKRSGCKIVCGLFKQQWYSGVSGRLSHLVDIYLALWVAKRLGRTRRNIWYQAHLRPDIMLNDGEAIPGFEDWRLIKTPGHTAMDVSLLNEKRNLLYVADLVVKVKGKLSPPFPVNLPEQYASSLQKLKRYTHCDVLMAHVPQQKITRDEVDNLLALAPEKAQNNRQVLTDLARRLARFRP